MPYSRRIQASWHKSKHEIAAAAMFETTNKNAAETPKPNKYSGQKKSRY
jgi:hypothetical protein